MDRRTFIGSVAGGILAAPLAARDFADRARPVLLCAFRTADS
jgi:hypothetical protein